MNTWREEGAAAIFFHSEMHTCARVHVHVLFLAARVSNIIPHARVILEKDARLLIVNTLAERVLHHTSTSTGVIAKKKKSARQYAIGLKRRAMADAAVVKC